MSSPPQPKNKVRGGNAPKTNLNQIKKHFHRTIEKIEYEDNKGSFNNIFFYVGNNIKIIFSKRTKDFPEVNLETIIKDLNDIRELFRMGLSSSDEEIETEIREQFFKNADDAKLICTSIQITSKNNDSLIPAQRYLSNLSGQLELVCSDIDKLQENRNKINNWLELIQDE